MMNPKRVEALRSSVQMATLAVLALCTACSSFSGSAPVMGTGTDSGDDDVDAGSIGNSDPRMRSDSGWPQPCCSKYVVERDGGLCLIAPCATEGDDD